MIRRLLNFLYSPTPPNGSLIKGRLHEGSQGLREGADFKTKPNFLTISKKKIQFCLIDFFWKSRKVGSLILITRFCQGVREKEMKGNQGKTLKILLVEVKRF